MLVEVGTVSTEAVDIVELDTAGREEGIVHPTVAVGVIDGELGVVDIIVIVDELIELAVVLDKIGEEVFCGSLWKSELNSPGR